MFKLLTILIIFTINFNIMILAIVSTSEKSQEKVLHVPGSPVPASQSQYNYGHRAYETERRFLQRYNSYNPVIILLDNIQNCHEKAYNFMKNLYEIEIKVRNVDFMLMKFNTTGASSIIETTKNNRNRFKNLLQQSTSTETTSYLSYENTNKSAVFFGILNAAKYLQPFSAIIAFVKRQIEDEELAQYALTEVLNKRIKVFVIWGGKKEERLLKEFALRTGGDFYPTLYKNRSEVYYEAFLENVNMLRSVSMILSRKNLLENVTLHIPIDSAVTGIHISITPNITSGTLLTPRGSMIDVLESEDVAEYSPGSFLHRDGGIHEIHLNTTTATTQDVGVWRLRVSNARNYYNITIFAHTKLTTDAFITFEHLTDSNKTGTRRKIMKLGVTGDITSISNITFVNKDGHPIFDKIKFKYDKEWENHLTENIDDIETNQKKELDLELEQLPQETVYAVISGKDLQGHSFTRLSYVRGNGQRDSSFYLPPLTIEVGLGSELITQSFRQPQIYFEITNNGNSPTFVRFICRDEKSNLLYLSPWSTWIIPQETVTVRLNLITRQGYYQDLITFYAIASETITKKVIVDVGSHREDTHDPELHYHFTSDCIGVLSCEDGTWTVEVKAKDTDSGLLQVISRPRGLHFPNGFTTGTTQEVTGYFTESCCRPDLELIALDRQINRRTRKINAYYANLGPWVIVAIVLGIVILLILIVGLICLCKNKKWICFSTSKASFNLPIYKGPSGSKHF